MVRDDVAPIRPLADLGTGRGVRVGAFRLRRPAISQPRIHLTMPG